MPVSSNNESDKSVLVQTELSEFRTTIPTVVTDGGHRLEDGRTQRALTEEMDVWLSQEGGIYGVQKGESGSIYEVDVVSETCSCPDWQTGEPDGGCKHLRRVDMEIRAGRVPRPDGRLTESAAVIEIPAEEARR